MKVIFLDIDGVLNGYNWLSLFIWNVITTINKKVKHKLYAHRLNPVGIHESKVKRLAKIVHKTGAVVVLSSSWRFSWYNHSCNSHNKLYKLLTDMFEKYNIKVIDVTPKVNVGDRDMEIYSWLSKHEEQLYSYVILDDEPIFTNLFKYEQRFVQTSNVKPGQMIIGAVYENSGLKHKHIKQCINILNTPI